ncbi:zinc finger protein [Cardiosporidium cionae]|uniref:Zinc finger protein n=1 Tax=Cardiosporidium cionae TaxID=476202 RepID=A0ABQ7JD94_9APIC|nr:zinc finger protein [Cardiosporidium cionae]|eukprot:KAF8821964.1 zinc finger protein [Cardiosporidium cionae]
MGVGKSFVAQDEFHAMGKGFCLPAEYDSSFLLDTKPLNSSLTLHLPTEIEEDPSSTGEEQDHENFIEQSTAVGVLPQYIFKHDYVIYDTSQSLPRYLIQFECDPAYPENFCLPLCDNCQDAPSLIWCPSDNARYSTHLSFHFQKQHYLLLFYFCDAIISVDFHLAPEFLLMH